MGIAVTVETINRLKKALTSFRYARKSRRPFRATGVKRLTQTLGPGLRRGDESQGLCKKVYLFCFETVPYRVVWGAMVFGGVLLLLTGCVYLRLLDVKGQLNRFDENFFIRGDSEFWVEFRHPLLKMKDVRFLIGADPLSVSKTDGIHHHYEFELLPGETATTLPPLHRLGLGLDFKDGLLVRIRVPDPFLRLFSRAVLEETLRQAKNSNILELQKLARAQIFLTEKTDAELPSLEKTLELLGPPLKRSAHGPWQTLTWRYVIVGADRSPSITARLSFDATGRLHTVYVLWDESAVEADFMRGA